MIEALEDGRAADLRAGAPEQILDLPGGQGMAEQRPGGILLERWSELAGLLPVEGQVLEQELFTLPALQLAKGGDRVHPGAEIGPGEWITGPFWVRDLRQPWVHPAELRHEERRRLHGPEH